MSEEISRSRKVREPVRHSARFDSGQVAAQLPRLDLPAPAAVPPRDARPEPSQGPRRRGWAVVQDARGMVVRSLACGSIVAQDVRASACLRA